MGEDRLMVIVKYALNFVSSAINTNDDSYDTNLRNVNQYFHFLKTTCKYVSISETYSETNSLPILHIWQYFLSSKVFQLNECIPGKVVANTIEQYENELFETILTTFKNKDLFKDLVNSLIEKLKAEVTSMDNQERFCRLMNIVANLANLTLEAESDENYEVRQTALERVIQIIQDYFIISNLGSKFSNKDFLAILKFEKTLLETTKPILKSQGESILLRNSALLRLDKILTKDKMEGCNDIEIPEKQKFFISSWNMICDILSTALYKRPSYLVKSRVPLIVAIFRNLLFGLTHVSNQLLYEATKTKKPSVNSLKAIGLSDMQALESMSHNLDRCLDIIRGDKLKDDFARVAPYMIADMLEAGFSGRVTVIQSVKNNLLSGIYKLLDICAKHSLDYLLNTLPVGQQDVFKEMLGNYKQYHKYSGKI